MDCAKTGGEAIPQHKPRVDRRNFTETIVKSLYKEKTGRMRRCLIQ